MRPDSGFPRMSFATIRVYREKILNCEGPTNGVNLETLKRCCTRREYRQTYSCYNICRSPWRLGPYHVTSYQPSLGGGGFSQRRVRWPPSSAGVALQRRATRVHAALAEKVAS